MNTHLVKSVFKAPVPAYCLAHASALSAQAVCETQKGRQSRSFTNQRVRRSIPGYSSLHIKVFLNETLNPETLSDAFIGV